MVHDPSLDKPTPTGPRRDVRAMAADLFLLGFPLVFVDNLRRAHPLGMNRMLQVPSDGRALAPGLAEESARTVRTSAWLDLSDWPVILRLPHMGGRHFGLTLFDAVGEPFASLGSRTGDGEGAIVAIAGPHWHGELKGRLKARRSPTEAAWAISRITAHSMADRDEAERLAADQRLSYAPDEEDAAPRGPLPWLEAPAIACLQQVADMAPEVFHHRVGLLLKRAPRTFQDGVREPLGACMAALAGLGDAERSDRTLRQAASRGFADGLAALRAATALYRDVESGCWRVTPGWPTSPPTDPLARAAHTLMTLGAPAADDVLSLVCDLDESGRELSGTERYRVHFRRGAQPPVKAFWSLLAHDGASAEARHGLGEHSDLAYNPDGSLDVLIQHSAPHGGGLNWLRAPEGPFTLVMRLHWPRPPALSGEWQMPSVERLGSRFARRAAARAKASGAPPSGSPPFDELRSDPPAWSTPP